MRYLLDRITGLVAGIATVLAGGFGPALASQPEDWALGLQPAATVTSQQAHEFHTMLLVIITAIVIFVLGLLVYVMWRFNARRNPTPSTTTHNTMVEVVWTVVPIVILGFIMVPSLDLLYALDRTEDPEMTLLVRGHTWYWSYEYPDQQVPEFQSHLVPDEELAEDQIRLLSTYDPTGRTEGVVVLPVDTNIQILVTTEGVLHSWAVPAFTVKTDAITGRMNETWVRIETEGTYYGQCSELCGEGHAFMPIEIRAVSREAFDAWVIERTAGIDFEEPPVLLTRSYPGFEAPVGEEGGEPAQDQASLVPQTAAAGG